MATVHPSRLGLVPGGAKASRPPPADAREEELRRKVLERRREKREDNGTERDPHGNGSRLHDEEHHQNGRHERSPNGRDHRETKDGAEHRSSRRDRSPSPPPRRDQVRRPRSDSPGRPSNSRDDRRDGYREDREDRDRRASPSYKPYERPRHRETGFIPPDEGAMNGAPPPPCMDSRRGGWQAPPPQRGGYNGVLDFENRRLERERNPLNIWPPSPKQPFRDEDELEADRKASKRKSKKSKSSKRSKRRSKRYSDSDDTASETDSEEERYRRRRRKEKEAKEKERKKRYSDADSEDERRKKRRTSMSERAGDDEAADQWVEKGGEVVLVPKFEDRARLELPPAQYDDDDDDVEVGPHLPVEHGGRERLDRSAYTNLLRGEGEAMAAFVASGQRIPRRGEIGLESVQISAFEQMGYVMSGSRHRRMNAVRMRKENQVINAEEKRAILNLQREEKMKKEGMIISQFREMLTDNLNREDLEKR